MVITADTGLARTTPASQSRTGRRRAARHAGPTLATRLAPRSNSLNAIRLVLACTVILSHSWMLGRFGRTPNFAGETPGGWSVFAFFALSGYLVTGSRVSTGMADYVRRRALRIYPGFLVCLLSTELDFGPIGFVVKHHTLHGYATTRTTPIDYLLVNITMKMSTYHVAGTPDNSHDWTGSLWSLYYEFLCYLIIGLLAFWGPFRRHVSVALTLLVLVTLARLELAPLQHFAHSEDFTLLLRLVPYFLAGSVLFLARDRIPCRGWLAVTALVVFLLVAVIGGNRFVAVCALPMGYVLLYLGAVVPVTLGRRNDLSYGLYMYGYPVERLVRLLHLHSHLLFLVLADAGTVPLAAASWFGIERRAMRLGRPPRPAPAAPPTTPIG